MSTFYIPEPCHEKWDKMTPKEQGRHCDVCSKVVVDFTQKTKQEVETFLTGAGENVCGHFRVSQLDPAEQNKVFRNPRNLFSRNWKYFAMTVMGFFLLGKKTEAQKMGKIKISGGPRPIQNDLQAQSNIKLNGTVYTPEHKPAGGALIVFSSGGKVIGKTNTIANGTYSYTFNREKGELYENRIDIEVSYRSYEPKIIQGLNLPNAQNVLNVTLEEMALIMGQVILPYKAPEKEPVKMEECKVPIADSLVQKEETIQKETTKEPEKKDQEITIRPDEITVTIYPNPAQTSATIYCRKNSNYTMELFDAKGTLQMSKTFLGDRTEVEVSGLSRGAYFVKLRDEENHTHTMKLVKQ